LQATDRLGESVRTTQRVHIVDPPAFPDKRPQTSRPLSIYALLGVERLREYYLVGPHSTHDDTHR